MLTKTLKRAAAGAAGLSLAFAGAAIVATPAHAGSVTTKYTCVADFFGTPFTTTMNVTTSIPDVSDPTKVTITSTATIDAATAQTIRDVFKPAAIGAKATGSFWFEAPNETSTEKAVELTVPKFVPPSFGEVKIVTSGTANVAPGTYTVYSDAFTNTIIFYDASGNESPLTSKCSLPAGETLPTVGKLDARVTTTTALTSAPAAPYVGGPAAVVTAKVTGVGGTPAGSVNFVVNGVTTNVKLAADATAAFTVPAPTAAGVVNVDATFVPADATKQVAGAAAKIAVTYVKAASTTSLSFTPTTAPVGDQVSAIAKVVGPDGKPLAGSVDFVTGATTSNVALAADGTATFVMPAVTKGGPVSVSANFKPTNVTGVETSTATATVTRTMATTTTKATMKPKKVRMGSRVKLNAKVSTTNAAVVTGKATVVIKTKGYKRKITRTVAGGEANWGITINRKFKPGKYTAMVKYLGVPSSFSGSKAKKITFWVM